jgi:zinc transport system substrate-binding protein
MTRIYLAFALAAVAILAAIFLLGGRPEGGLPGAATRGSDDRVTVAVTIYPWADLARRIAGDRARIIQLVPDGAEPHDFEASPQIVRQALDTDIVLLNGLGIDPWAEEIAAEAAQTKTEVLEAADLGKPLHTADHPEEAHDHEETGHDHAAGQYDPHIWLDIPTAKAVTKTLAESLARQDSVNADVYLENMSALHAELDAIDAAYRTELAACSLDTAIVSHDAFGYLTRNYGVTFESIAGLSPHDEPSPRTMATLADRARTLGIRHVFLETLADPRLARTIAEEVGAETLVLDPIEGVTATDADPEGGYTVRMRRNLENLEIALACP